MANQVTLTFAGDTKDAEQAFDRVGKSSDDMGRRVENSGASFDRASEGFDSMDTKAMGFRDTLTGVQDGALGIKQAAAGDWGFETLLLLGTGIGDLASGMVNFLVPAVKSASVAIKGMNLALFTSPITWIIIAVLALIAVIVLIATKTDWFQRAWRASWKFIREAAGAAWDWIKTKSLAVWEFMKKIPGWLKSAFGKVAGFLIAPYKLAFNTIAKLWNATIGRLSWTVPDWIPVIGGNSVSVPKLPTFHAGGTMPGVVGRPAMALLQGGERIGSLASGSGREDWVRIDIGELGDALIKAVQRGMSRYGGRADALGIRVINKTVRG